MFILQIFEGRPMKSHQKIFSYMRVSVLGPITITKVPIIFFRINPVDCNTVITITSLKESITYGLDGIPYHFIKDCLPAIDFISQSL